MSLKVLLLGPVAPPEGGVSRHVDVLKERLLARGHSCTVAATTDIKPADRRPENLYPRGPVALIKCLRRSRADVVHLHLGGRITLKSLIISLIAFQLAKRSVVTIHSGEFPEQLRRMNGFKRKLTAMIFRRSGRAIAVSDEIFNALLDLRLEKEKCVNIPPFFLLLPDPATKLNEDLEVFAREHSPLLIAAGGSEPEYAPLEQLEAISRLKETFPRVGFVIVGEGSMRPTVEKAIGERELRSHVFLAGNLSHDACLHLIERSDLMLRTTLFDGDAISVRESLFLGTSVLATRVGNRPQGVQFIEELSASAIARGVEQVLATENKLQPAASSDLSQIDRVIELYENLVSRS